MTLIPRPYQLEALKAALVALKKKGMALVVLATGLGKTIAAALIAQKFNKLPILFLVHNNDILENSVKEFKRVFGEELKAGLFNGYSKNIQDCDIVFASFQTMGRNLKRFKRNQFQLMIVDEGHHAQAETYREVVEYFRCAKLAVTATPDRMDMQDIRQLFGDEVINISLEEAIARNWLPRIEYHLVADEGLDENRLKELAKEMVEEGERITLEEINRRVFIRARDEKIAEIIEAYNEKTVVFCRNITHATNFSKFLKHSLTYHSGNSRDQNREALKGLRHGLTRRVLAVNAFNEGIDVPDVGLVVFNRATDSETIFRQQLGRGLRPGKEKLVVLDFVGNIQRIQMIKKLTDKVADFHEKFTTEKERSLEGYAKDTFHLTGKGFEFTFTDRVVDIMKLIDRANVELYATCEEAAKAAQRLRIQTSIEYDSQYKEDPKLPSSPIEKYANFPGWKDFLNTNGKHYSTWQEAGAAAKKLGIKTKGEYGNKRHLDPRLYASPAQRYPTFPGWTKFLGKNRQSTREYYSTWKMAAQAAKRLGIKTWSRYGKIYSRDTMLHRQPHLFYSDFPGWDEFFGRSSKPEPYPTWQAAWGAAKKLQVSGRRGYKKSYKKDPRLPSTPEKVYKNFPGWKKFLGNS